MRRTVTATAILVAAAAVWGSTFGLVKDAIDDVPPLQFLAMRFAIGTLVLGAFWSRSLRRIPWRGCGICGLALATGYAFQTYGLVFTGATNAGFVTGLAVVFTPLFAALVLKRRLTVPTIGGVILAAAGLTLLSLQLTDGRPIFNRGDVLVLVAAASFAIHIVGLGRFAPATDTRGLAIGQLAVATVAFTVVMPAGGLRAVATRDVLVALAVTGIGATAFGFAAMTWAQARLSPTRTAVVLTSEPVFAGLFGLAILGERLSGRQWIGAALILAGMLAVEARPQKAQQEA